MGGPEAIDRFKPRDLLWWGARKISRYGLFIFLDWLRYTVYEIVKRGTLGVEMSCGIGKWFLLWERITIVILVLNISLYLT